MCFTLDRHCIYISHHCHKQNMIKIRIHTVPLKPKFVKKWAKTKQKWSVVAVRTMDTTYLYIGMILFTLSLSSHGFALGLYPKGLIPMEIFVHPYIPIILPISSQCGTLIVYSTILPSNKGPPSLPSNRPFIRPLSTNQDSSFSTSPCWGQDTSMKHPESTTWLESFCSF